MRRTRLVLFLPNGDPLRDTGGHIIGIDLSRVPNPSSTTPVLVVVEQQCDMEDWHRSGRTALPVYDLELEESQLEVSHEAARGG
jgi:hypothetical protein